MPERHYGHDTDPTTGTETLCEATLQDDGTIHVTWIQLPKLSPTNTQ